MAVKNAPNRKYIGTVLAVLALLAWQYYNPATRHPANLPVSQASGGAVQAAFTGHSNGVWLETRGTVLRLLADDNEGARHQRFILDTGNGLTVLVAHNIDLAGRVPLAAGDQVDVRGRYEWNERGGVIHWTHRDPQGREAGGWIRKHATLYR
jgi:hypothetical protein